MAEDLLVRAELRYALRNELRYELRFELQCELRHTQGWPELRRAECSTRVANILKRYFQTCWVSGEIRTLYSVVVKLQILADGLACVRTGWVQDDSKGVARLGKSPASAGRRGRSPSFLRTSKQRPYERQHKSRRTSRRQQALRYMKGLGAAADEWAEAEESGAEQQERRRLRRRASGYGLWQ